MTQARAAEGQKAAPARSAPAEAGKDGVAIAPHPYGIALADLANELARSVQPKLAVGSAGDALETEADRVAEVVLRMPDHNLAGAAGDRDPPPPPSAAAQLRRQSAACAEEDRGVQRRADIAAPSRFAEAPPLVEEALHGGAGRPLDKDARAYFEPRFGFDFSAVRIHTDHRADASARAVNALAYTVGRDIVFGQGHYAPHAPEGRRLLAHELTHVVQQSGGAARPGAPAVQRAPSTALQRKEQPYEARLRQVVAGSLGEQAAAAVLEIKGWTSDPLDTLAKGDDVASAVQGAYDKLRTLLKNAGFATLPAAGTMRLVTTTALDASALAKVQAIASERHWTVVTYRAVSAASIVEDRTVNPAAALAPAAAPPPPAAAPSGPPARLALPGSITVNWGGDPFLVEILLKKNQDSGHNDLVFKISYAGTNDIEGGSAAAFFETRVLFVESLQDAKLIENRDPKATRIDIDLRPEMGGSVTAALSDTVVERLIPGKRGGREHSFSAERSHQSVGSATIFVIDKQVDKAAKAMPARKPGDPYWIEKPVTPPRPKPDHVPPSQASAEPSKKVSDIWSVDVTLGGFHDKFRVTIQPTSPVTALFGMAAMQGGSVNGGGGAALTGKAAFAPALLEARGDTITLSLHGGKDADLTIKDSIVVPKADLGLGAGGSGTSGDAKRDRDHRIKISGPEIGGDATFEFHVRDNVNIGSRNKTVTDLDVRAMANAAAVTAIPEQLKLGGIDEESERYEDVLFTKRKSAYDLKAIPDAIFKSYGVMYITLGQLRRQVAKGKVDAAQQRVAADFATKFTSSVNDELKSSPLYGANEGKALADAIRSGTWGNVWTLWRGITFKFDTFILDRMKDKLGSNFFGTKDFKVLLDAKKRVDDLRGKQDVVHLAALYFPDPKYRNQRNMLTSIPLSIYYFREDGKWKLKDYSDPDKEPIKHEVPDNGKPEPPVELFTQLDHLAEYPRGIIRWQIPGGSSGSFPTTDKQTTGEQVITWLGRIALVAGAIGLALTGVGAVLEIGAVSTLGTVFLAASAVAGGFAAGVDLYEKARQGTLTAMDAIIDVAQIAASLASLGTIPHGYFVNELRQGVALTARAMKIAALASDVYIPLRAISLGADVVTVLAVTKQTLDELEKIKKLPIEQQNEAWIITVAQLFVTAGMSIVSIKGTAGELREGVPRIKLRINEHGVPVAEIEGASRTARVSDARTGEGEGTARPDERVTARPGEPATAKPVAKGPAEGTSEVGGTRGSYGPAPTSGPRPAYLEKPGKGESSPGNLASRVKSNFVTPSPTQRPLAHNAKLEIPATPPTKAGAAPSVAGAAPPAPAPQTQYTLVIPASGARPEMKIPVTIESTKTRPTSVHGADTGPAGMKVRSTTDASGVVHYEATIQVHNDLAQADVRHAVGHELDELALIAESGVTGAKITAQKRASLLQPIKAPAPGATPPPATFHDTANAREFAQAMPKQGGRPAGYEVPPEVMSRAQEMGFENTAFLDEKLALLRNSGVDEDMLRRLQVMATRAEQVSPRLPVGSALDTPRLVGHLLHSSGGSAVSPVGGAHLDSVLTKLQADLVASNDPIHLVRTADSPRPPLGGVNYNAYEQWRWKGGGTPGARPTTPAGVHPATFPTPPPVTGGHWELAIEAKTTFDNLGAFMAEAQAAFTAYTAMHPPAPGSSNIRWSAAAGPGRQQIGGYFSVDAAGKQTHISVFPDRAGGVASW